MTTRRLFLVAVLLPTVTSGLGIDGGAIFQIVAARNLGLSARAMGIAFGLGIVSVPVQLMAARLPLGRARSNLQLFLVVAAVQCAVLGVLVATLDPGDRLAVIALAVTVLAEITLSVLYATSWQPLLSVSLASEARQRVNSRGIAAGGATKAAAALVVGVVVGRARVAFYAVFAAVAIGLALSLRPVPNPVVPPRPADGESGSEPGGESGAASGGEPVAYHARIPAAMRPVYLAVGLVAAGAWPLFIVYVDKVLWPTINLGVVAAVQLSGSLLAASLWRATSADVAVRARWGAAASLAAVLALASVRAPVDGQVEQLVFFVATAGAAAATSTMFFTLLESAHRAIDAHSAVRAMTVYDVVASTSMQAGLLAGGFLIAASHGGRFDAYRLYLVVSASAVVVVLTTLGRPRPGRRPTARSDSGAASAPGPGAAAPSARPRSPDG